MLFDTHIPDFSVTYTINNTSNQAIVVKHKGGLGYIVPATRDNNLISKQELIVKVECRDIENILISENDALTRIDREILKQFNEERNRIVNADFYYSKNKTLICRIPLGSQFVDSEYDVIQSEILGFSLYSGIQHQNKPAVGTPLWTLNDVLNQTKELSNNSGILRLAIFVNDPGRVSPPYFINFMGGVMRVPVIHDNDINTGLYIAYVHSDRPRQDIYYAFDEVTKAILERYGIFDNKHDCEKGGNTERFTRAEEQAKGLKKSLDVLNLELETVKTNATKLETSNKNLTSELSELKYQHGVQLDRINYTHKTELTHMKHDLRMKENISKANLDFAKQKVAHVYWGDFAKAIGAVAGAGFAGYKLLSS